MRPFTVVSTQVKTLAPRLRRACGTSLLCFCVVSVACSDSPPTGPTTPTPVATSIDSASVEGRWEGSYVYGHTEPAGCPVIGLNGPTCPTAPVALTLTLNQSRTGVSGELTTSIFGDAGSAAAPFPLIGRLSGLSLELTGEQAGGDVSCMHTTVRRMVSFTLRRTTTNALEGEFHFDGDRRSSSCFFFDVQVYAREVRLMHVSR